MDKLQLIILTITILIETPLIYAALLQYRRGE